MTPPTDPGAMTRAALDQERFERVREEWGGIASRPPIDLERFANVKAQADALAEAGHWDSGPSDMLSVLGRQRDELMHSRLIAWLLVPTHRHGLGRAVLTGFLDSLWPGEELMRTGPVVADLEVPGAGLDDLGRFCDARADIVLRGDRLTVVVENKLDAGEQPEQCERLYWAFADGASETRWVFLTPTGRAPLTATSESARPAWRTMGYSQLRSIIALATEDARASTSTGRATAAQYLETLTRSVVRSDD